MRTETAEDASDFWGQWMADPQAHAQCSSSAPHMLIGIVFKTATDKLLGLPHAPLSIGKLGRC